ncbi:hypothetical protein C8F04DRAFT_1087773, partial [Mycena alexandri]
MRFTAATIAALVAFFAFSSSTLAGDVDDNKVGSTLPRDATLAALTVILVQKCSPCRVENSCIKGRCTPKQICPGGHTLEGNLCCPPKSHYPRAGEDGQDGGKGGN